MDDHLFHNREDYEGEDPYDYLYGKLDRILYGAYGAYDEVVDEIIDLVADYLGVELEEEDDEDVIVVKAQRVVIPLGTEELFEH